MSPANWGVPDWLRPQDYPAPDEAGALMIWAWEFFRRNQEFRDFWLKKVEPFITADGRIGRDQTGIFWPYYNEMRNRFGIVDPCSPRQNNCVPAFDLSTKFVEAPAITHEFLPAQGSTTGPFVRPSRASISDEMISENARLQLSWYEMGFSIDLRLPLDNQINTFRRLAEKDQIRLKSAGLVDPRGAKSSDKYVVYLRILDAEDAGARRSDIENTLFPKLSNDHEWGRPRSKAYDNARAGARRLRDFGYRALAHHAKAPSDAALK